ncbi:DEAD/DEAH box helicase [Actinomycetospora corticicola]|uniref:Superfamily II DNA/RNA helicase n=1 Tax=Actinomycetospora corticicola TaxID=663602 RepID=A0A7Y9J8H4_9PSEU|nr:DEAD/DEAH box helicase [Actinomycetospora corticicola]NYD39430.1 superfamily II DNA/RNA helicase [Actinomycetospora corticicola]
MATTTSSDASPTFAELGVIPEIVESLAANGIERTFAIQELTLPLALAGEDVIGQARTGTGKTLGFGVPLLQRLGTPTEDGTPRALVVVPTRELCLQVAKDLEAASKGLGSRVVSIYGGRPYEQQIAALQAGVELVVGTPGRLLDLAQQGHLVLAKVGGLVLDEADEMLDLGFLPDVERILGMLPAQRQTMLFSATMPGPIITLARTFLTQPTHIRAEQVDASAIGERTAQFVYRAHAMDKVQMLARTLQAQDRGPTMVFTRTKRTASKVSEELAERGFKVGAVHGDLGQGAREHALKAFRTGRIDVLVCTDVAARGIDVTGVTHVVNYQCPDDAKTYVHRIGRTGRAGKTGIAITLVDWDDLPKWKMISDDLELNAPEPPETYSNSPHLLRDLGIPADAPGRVARRRRPAEEESEATGEPERSDAVEEKPRAKRARSRTRRRAGEVVAGPEGGDDTADEAAVPEESSAAGPDEGGADEEGSGRSRPRRRRRGRGRARSDAPEGEAVAVGADTD